MAMLAEKRRKTRFVLNPVAKPLWLTESSGMQTGKRLMEKMGWSAGKGLGASEQGIAEPLRSVFKQDSKGMGYKGQGDPFENLDNFNALLASLSSNDTEDSAQTFESLEQKSKHSRSRVHYKKFTRGKDLSKCSSTDLSCIVGVAKKEEEPELVEEEEPDRTGETENSHGVTTINSGSIADYFKTRMMQRQLLTNDNSMATDGLQEENDNQQNNPTEEISESSSEANTTHTSEGAKVDQTNDDEISSELKSKKKKKKHKHAVEEHHDPALIGNGAPVDDVDAEAECKREERKTKKKKHRFREREQDEDRRVDNVASEKCLFDPADAPEDGEKLSKKKKKKMHQQNCEDNNEAVSMDENPAAETIDDSQQLKKKKRTHDSIKNESEEELNQENVEVAGKEEKKKKKRKSERKIDEGIFEDKANLSNQDDGHEETAPDVILEDSKSKKKRKKRDKESSSEDIPEIPVSNANDDDVELSDLGKKKKEKKRKNKEKHACEESMETSDHTPEEPMSKKQKNTEVEKCSPEEEWQNTKTSKKKDVHNIANKFLGSNLNSLAGYGSKTNKIEPSRD